MRPTRIPRTGTSAFIVLCMLAIGLFVTCPGVSLAAPADRPFDVLFIAVDDLNDWIHPLGGYPRVQTPNLDRLAARGVLFTHAYCSAPACNPSRASLLTGVAPSTSGVYHNSQPWRPVMPDVTTLPQHFMKQGYRVIGRGKIFHGKYNDPASWHEYIPRGSDPTPPVRPANRIEHIDAHFDWGPLDVDDADMDDAKVVAWAADRLKASYDAPLFLGVGIFRPHLPWYVPRAYFERYPLSQVVVPFAMAHDLDDVPPMGRTIARPEGDHAKVVATANWTRAVQGYLASIAFADACVGRLLDALDASGRADRTIIVLWGDHGWHLGEKLHWRKFALWEETTRVPLIIVAPGVTQPGRRCERTVSLLDLYPTLAELCHSTPPRCSRTPRAPGPTRPSPPTGGITMPFAPSGGDTSATATGRRNFTTTRPTLWNGIIWPAILSLPP